MILGAVLAVLYGVGVAVFKGEGSGVRYAVGNISAPWLIISCWLAVVVSVRRTWSARAAFVGAAMALLSLLSFYATVALMYGAVNAHTSRNNAFFLIAGSLGAGLVAWVVTRLASGLWEAVGLIGLVFLCEPGFTLAYSLTLGSMHTSTALVAVLECAIGCMAVRLAHQRRIVGLRR